MAQTKARPKTSLADEYLEMWVVWVLSWMIDMRMNGIDKP